MNQNEPPSLLRNHYTGTNGWLQVRAQGTKSNRDAIGASVTIEAAGWKQTAAILSQSSYLSANDLRLHFGLGTAKQVDRIVVRWPSGLSEEFPGVLANRLVLLVEGKGK
jgi:enediyne biosynthesis protein E4